MLLVSDEVICAFGRLGTTFACDKFGYVPDMITCAKGMTSGYSPIGACVISDRLAEPFYKGDNTFLHGYTFGGHPVSAAVGLANLDLFEREGLNQHVLDNEGAFRATLEKLHDLPIVGDVRGNGFFYGIELVKDKTTRSSFNDEETERVLYGFLSKKLFENGLYCRADDRGDPVIQLAPPLISNQETFDEIEQILRATLTEAWTKLDRPDHPLRGSSPAPERSVRVRTAARGRVLSGFLRGDSLRCPVTVGPAFVPPEEGQDRGNTDQNRGVRPWRPRRTTTCSGPVPCTSSTMTAPPRCKACRSACARARSWP
ncbi:Adenosylmethionine-8-amino-7-oxononanoate aminotransferase [Streptomyces violaceorubidus]